MGLPALLPTLPLPKKNTEEEEEESSLSDDEEELLLLLLSCLVLFLRLLLCSIRRSLQIWEHASSWLNVSRILSSCPKNASWNGVPPLKVKPRWRWRFWLRRWCGVVLSDDDDDGDDNDCCCDEDSSDAVERVESECTRTKLDALEVGVVKIPASWGDMVIFA